MEFQRNVVERRSYPAFFIYIRITNNQHNYKYIYIDKYIYNDIIIV